jgi:hypothetical protein
LGQIAYEATAGAGRFEWQDLVKHDREVWEAAAQAVRDAVIEECAKVCEYGPYPWASENSDRYHIQAEWSRHLQDKIRALKDKP